MSLDVTLARIVSLVIYQCATENEFAQFTYQVDAGTGWNWIFEHRTLKTMVFLPAPHVGPVNISERVTETVVHAARATKGWRLGSLYYNGVSLAADQINPPLTPRSIRIAYFSDLLKKLGESIEDARFQDNPAAGITLTTTHEGGITVGAIPGVAGALELTGDTSNGWPSRGDAYRAILEFVAQGASQRLGPRLAQVELDKGKEMLEDIVAESGDSCLVGLMVADLKDSQGRSTRLVSVSANMCGARGRYVAHTARGQGSQIHMEIFHLERLGAVLTHLGRTFAEVDVGILGVKSSNVVSENQMCGACQGTKATELDAKVPGTITTLNFGVSFLGP